MLVLFKAGWFRWLFGVVFLSLLIFLVHELRQTRQPILHPLTDPANRQIFLPLWVAATVAADFAAVTATLLVGTLLLPRRFLRAALRSSAAAFQGVTLPLAIAGAVMAGGLEEVLFRWEIQPALVDEFGLQAGIAGTAVAFGILHWSPFTNTLALIAVPRSYVYSTALSATGNPLVPCMARFIAEFAYLWGIGYLIRKGLTAEEPEVPERMDTEMQPR